jgi:hypothetical protein
MTMADSLAAIWSDPACNSSSPTSEAGSTSWFYKVDRLTHSLADFAQLIELFYAEGVS